jgi:transposase
MTRRKRWLCHAGSILREFKVNAVRELEAGRPLGEVARALEVLPSVLERWRSEYQADPGQAFPGSGVVAESAVGREAELERKVGQLTMENDFLKKNLSTLEPRTALERRQWRTMVYQEIKSQVAQHGGPSVSSLCSTVGVSRAGYYRGRCKVSSGRGGRGDLRLALRAVVAQMPAYGYRRITAALRRQELAVNHKRVLQSDA